MHCWGHQKGETTAVRENQKADWKAKWAALTGGQTSASLAAACSCVPYLNGMHGIRHKNRLGLRLKEKISYWRDDGSLLMAALPYLSHWLPHLVWVPWRNSLRANSSWAHLGPVFLCPQALQHKKDSMWKMQSVCQKQSLIFAGVCLHLLKMDKSLTHLD
jgi:hypothetical protein